MLHSAYLISPLKVLSAISLVLMFGGCSVAAEEQSFVGSAACAECHAAEARAWSASDHAWALREPSAANVLGDFKNASFSHKGVTTRFTMADGRYMVETDGSDGKPTQYRVRYTVGVRPLQQYLVETEGGRLQVLDIAWDTERKAWFHLYPHQDGEAGNGLHWTGSYRNWQARCAECHQTGFDKGYDARTKTYQSHWAELTIGCESCHGPASNHVAWARTAKPDASNPAPPMLKMGAGQQDSELAICGPCHSRREAFAPKSAPVGATFSDHFNLALLTPNLYFGDGQQREEVFILGSFLQSKMVAKGVTCSNCHEPHSGKLVAEGDAVCTQCHNEIGRSEFPTLARKAYDTEEHHHHKPESDAARCVSCHMPERAYMRIDNRRDHFFRRPDPLQSRAAGAPDACTSCHAGKSPEWAAQNIAVWFPKADRSWQDRNAFIAFNAGNRSPTILNALLTYARDIERPAITRATALSLLGDTATKDIENHLLPLLTDTSDLVRAATAGAMRQAEASAKVRYLWPLLKDPSRIVRHAAATELAASDLSSLDASEQAVLNRALAEYIDARNATIDMPESHMALAGLSLSMQQWQKAEASFQEATRMDPQLEDSWVMLVRIRAALNDEPGAERYTAEGLRKLPRSIPLLFERAGLEARRGNDGKAIDWYRRIIGVDNANFDAWLQLAASALRIKETGLALDASAKAMTLQPNRAEAFVIAAIANYLKGDLATAKHRAAAARKLSANIQLPAELEQLLRETR